MCVYACRCACRHPILVQTRRAATVLHPPVRLSYRRKRHRSSRQHSIFRVWMISSFFRCALIVSRSLFFLLLFLEAFPESNDSTSSIDGSLTTTTTLHQDLTSSQQSRDSDRTISVSGSTDSDRTPVRVDSQDSQVSDSETNADGHRWPRQNSVRRSLIKICSKYVI